MKLRPYQSRMETETAEAYAAGYRYILNQLSTGGGKTWLLASQVANTDGPTCTIVHRQELLGQISRTYAAAGIRHSILAPQPVINWIIETHVAEFGRSFFTPRSDAMVAGVDTLVRRYKPGDRWCNTVVKWLVDECFTAGTDIHMADGSLKHIETIEVGDGVVAFDETTSTFKPRKVTRLFKNSAPKHMVRLTTAHHVLYATSGHPFWTKRGWVNAGDLRHDDEVYTSAVHTVRNDCGRDDRDAAVSLAQDGQNILHTEVRLCVEGRFFAWQRLESVSVLEQGNHDIPGDGYVYNIEVDGLHTYVANGVVVHNCHHMLQDNKWGKACQLFPNALGYGVTATPIRADRRSLHVDQGGAFDYLVQGASMRDLVDEGSLVDYRVIAPESSINEAELRIGSTGDFTASSQKKAQRSEMFGDVVQTYLDRVPGKRAIVFTTGVEASRELCERFKAAGVRAMDLNGMTDDRTRSRAVQDFSQGRLDVLINTGLFDEGFDVPAVEVTIMARPTMSFGLFCQQIGRCLRPDPDNPGKYGWVIDHVGNVLRMAATHGMPDTPRRWKLWKPETERGAQRNPDAIPMRTCHGCGLAYLALSMVCPFCGTAHEPASRVEPQHVAGILSEMSPELLDRLRMARAGVEAERPRVPYGAAPVVVKAIEKRHRERQAAHRSLAEAMEAWGGIRRAAGDDDAAMQSRFYWRFGTDVGTAQTLNATDAIRLRDEIMGTLKCS